MASLNSSPRASLHMWREVTPGSGVCLLNCSDLELALHVVSRRDISSHEHSQRRALTYRCWAAAAVTAGLSAYFLKLIELGRLKDRHNNPVGNTPQAIKDFMSDPREALWSRSIVGGVDRPSVWNKADLDTANVCPWNPDRAAARLFRRKQSPDADSCYNPGSSTKTKMHPSPSVSISVPTDLPSLTTGFATRTGSSCASTTVQTDCALGPDGMCLTCSRRTLPTLTRMIARGTACVTTREYLLPYAKVRS